MVENEKNKAERAKEYDASQIQVLEAELSEVPGDLTLISLPSGSAVNTVAAEFLVALDLLWHR